MSAKNNGGPAFPSPGVVLSDGSQQGAYEGMSIRDYFAATALSGGLEQGLENDMAGSVNPASDHMWWHPPTKIARRAYAIADAMLAERAK